MAKFQYIYCTPKIHKFKSIQEAIVLVNDNYIEIYQPDDLKGRPITWLPESPTQRHSQGSSASTQSNSAQLSSTSPLSNFVNNLLKEFIKLNGNTDRMIKNIKHAELDTEIVTFFLEYINFKDDLIEYKCLCCYKNYQQNFDEKFREQFLHKNLYIKIF